MTPSSEFACLVGTCTNRVEDPLVPCGDCVALLGSYLQPSGREAGAGEVFALRARAAVRGRPAVVPARRPPPRLIVSLELTEEATHLVWWCGFSRRQAAVRLGVSRAAVDAALAAPGRAA